MPITPLTAEQFLDIVYQTGLDFFTSQGDVAYVVGVASPHFDSQIFVNGTLLDYNGNPLPFHNDVPFEIASISKVFTAALLTYHARQNPALWTTSLTSCSPPSLPSLPPSFDNITLLSLANYTSGLPEDDRVLTVDTPSPLPQPYTTLNMYSYLHDDNVTVTGTGTTFTYSNMAAALLANAIPAAIGSELSFAELLARDITGPLGMSGTRPFTEVPFTELPLAMSGGAPASAGWNQLPAFMGGSGLVSTANDMMTWLKLHMGLMPESPLNAIVEPMQTVSTKVRSASANGQLGVAWFFNAITGTNAADGKAFSLPIAYKAGEITGSSFICFLRSPKPGTIPSEAGMFVLSNNTLSEEQLLDLPFAVMLALNGILNATNVTVSA